MFCYGNVLRDVLVDLLHDLLGEDGHLLGGGDAGLLGGWGDRQVCRGCHEGEHKGGDSAGRSTLGEEQHMIIWREVFWGVLGVEEGEEKVLLHFCQEHGLPSSST